MSFNCHVLPSCPSLVSMLDGNFLPLVPRPPAPLVRRLAQSDAIDPRPQRRLAVKAAYSAKDLNEDFLSKVGGVGAVAHGARQQRINGLMVMRDQPRKRLLGAGSQFFNESRLFGLERQRASKIAHGEVRLQFSALPRYRNSPKVSIRASQAEGQNPRLGLQLAWKRSWLAARKPIYFLDTGSCRNVPVRERPGLDVVWFECDAWNRGELRVVSRGSRFSAPRGKNKGAPRGMGHPLPLLR